MCTSLLFLIDDLMIFWVVIYSLFECTLSLQLPLWMIEESLKFLVSLVTYSWFTCWVMRINNALCSLWERWMEVHREKTFPFRFHSELGNKNNNNKKTKTKPKPNKNTGTYICEETPEETDKLKPISRGLQTSWD